MPAAALEVQRREPQRLEPVEVCGPELGERVQQLMECLAARGLELGKAVEGGERTGLAMGQQDLGADDPVSALAGQAGDRRVLL